MLWSHAGYAPSITSGLGRARQAARGRTQERRLILRQEHTAVQSHILHSPVGTTGRAAGATGALGEGHSPAGTSGRPVRVGSGLRRGGERDPEKYLHRILH
ncbi:unnamed protein product [Pleuronectes platessa]|uniref:Uncharacterized protein n=1 Tax=Pleuronectes platessa TaxID=8262 RepID=A0A9N7VSY5_PLEPL|nr:unnamed protein product [Pleuronectes platessa]